MIVSMELAPEEQALRLEYEKYLNWHKDWMIEEIPPLSFDSWWREYGDAIKENMEGK